MLHKVLSVVVNCRLKRSAVIHDALHGFKEGRGVGTAALEANLAQQMVGITHKPLFQVLLDVQKSYESLDRERCPELLTGYGMETNLDWIIDNY